MGIWKSKLQFMPNARRWFVKLEYALGKDTLAIFNSKQWLCGAQLFITTNNNSKLVDRLLLAYIIILIETFIDNSSNSTVLYAYVAQERKRAHRESALIEWKMSLSWRRSPLPLRCNQQSPAVHTDGHKQHALEVNVWGERVVRYCCHITVVYANGTPSHSKNNKTYGSFLSDVCLLRAARFF